MTHTEKARQFFFEGIAFMENEDYSAAERAFREALALVPGRVSIITNLTAALLRQEKYKEAKDLSFLSIELDTGNAQGHLNLGLCLAEEREWEGALTHTDRALDIEPDYAEAWVNRGIVLKDLHRYIESLESYDRALALKPNHAEAWFNKGNALNQIGHSEEALEMFEKALLLNSADPRFWLSHGAALSAEKRFDQALVSITKALELRPDIDGGYGQWLYNKRSACDWGGIETAYEEIALQVAAGKNVTGPFTMLSTPMHPVNLKACATLYVSSRFPWNPNTEASGPRTVYAKGKKIRIGYFSADFHNHPGMSLMAELFEIHDRNRFEIYAFSFGPDAEDKLRRRVVAGVDHFMDVHNLSDQAVAVKARDLGIDIAVHRNGHTIGGRTGIFAHRAAPLQINYLGYPGTLGAPYIDYIIADPVLIPETHRDYYTEKIAYLPHSYQPNDRKREISPRIFTRAELGLPENGFVFCCFNNDYKLTPDVFDIWMRILKQVPRSVLWLLGGNEFSGRNLQSEAERRGIAAERLIFAGRVDRAEHLSRHRQADLFVDTFYYNAHTTASDALWAGLPVVTCKGEAFASRVAASLLNAMGLPELIAKTPQEYEALILELATQPDKLSVVRDKLAQNRLEQPLFNTELYARHLEKAFEMMCERHRQGLPPDHVFVPA